MLGIRDMISSSMSDDVAQMLHSLPRQRFDAAKAIVDRATAVSPWRYLFLFASLGCAAVLLVGSVIALAILEQSPVWLGIAIVVSSILLVAGIVGMGSKTSAKKVLNAMTCPRCSAATIRAAGSETYLLICVRCQVVWETAVRLPGGGDGGHVHDHHHHHHDHHHLF